MDSPSSETMKVLIAEDDPASGRLLATSIGKLGYEALLATNGRDAWYTYVSERPRIIITDWMMPILDGPEFCRKIRAEGRTQYTFIILLTALSGKERFAEGMSAGADDFITKPLDLEILRVRLTVARRVLGLQHRVSELRGLLPICAYCKRIRNEDGSWQRLEEYVSGRTSASFSHTFCPECNAKAS